MNRLGKRIMEMGLVSLLSVLPLAAQVDDGAGFTTAFPFYAGSTKLPAGSYKITQPDMNPAVLQIESTDGKTTVFVRFIPTESAQPHGKSAVTFHRYGDADYLDRVWLAGETDGVMLGPTKAEAKAAGNRNVADPSAVSGGQ
jgi:hypothetical protein